MPEPIPYDYRWNQWGWLNSPDLKPIPAVAPAEADAVAPVAECDIPGCRQAATGLCVAASLPDALRTLVGCTANPPVADEEQVGSSRIVASLAYSRATAAYQTQIQIAAAAAEAAYHAAKSASDAAVLAGRHLESIVAYTSIAGWTLGAAETCIALRDEVANGEFELIDRFRRRLADFHRHDSIEPNEPGAVDNSIWKRPWSY